MPSPRKPIPRGVAISRTCARCAISSRLRLVHGLDRRARQFELPARLQRDRAAAGNVVEADDVALLHDRLPAEQELHALQQRADALGAFVRHGVMALERERRLLVLGADPEFGRRLHAGCNPRHEFVARFQRRHIDLVTRHANSSIKGARAAHGVQESPREPQARGRERVRKVHRTGAPSPIAGDCASLQEQPRRSSRPLSFMASASDNFEPTCFSIAAE